MTMRLAAIGVLVLTGCSPFSFSERPLEPGAPEGRGRLVLRAGEGHIFNVWGSETAQTFAVGPGGPIVVGDLAPGHYQVRVAGRHIETYICDVKVRAGQETTVRFKLRSVIRSGVIEELAVVTGKTIIYVVGGVVYVLIRASIEMCLGSDDDDDSDPCAWCGHSPCTCPRKTPRETPKETPKPRVRDLLDKKP